MEQSEKSHLQAQSFFVPEEMLEEAENVSKHLQMSRDFLFWAAWECGKMALHVSTAVRCQEGEPMAKLPTPAAVYPPDFSPGPPIAVEPLRSEQIKKKITVSLPSRVLEEIKNLACFSDRSLSWCLQKAYLAARSSILGIKKG